MREFCVLSLLVLCIGLSGCNKIDRAVDEFDRLIDVVDQARRDMNGESSKWRETLVELEKDLKKAGADALARDLRNFVDHSIDSAGVELRCNIDFVEAKVDANLLAIRAALVRKKEQVKKNGKLDGTIEEIIKSVAFEPQYLPPHICKPTPRKIILSRQPGTSKLSVNLNEATISFTGYGLIGDPNNKWKPQLAIVDKHGRERRLKNVEGAVAKSSAYIVQVNLQPIVDQFRTSDAKFALLVGDKARYEVPINFESVERKDIEKTVTITDLGTMRVTPGHVKSSMSFPVYGRNVRIVSVKDFEKRMKQTRLFGNAGLRLFPQANVILVGLKRRPIGTGEMSHRLLTVPKGGDTDSGGDGPLVTVVARLRIARDRKTLTAHGSMWAAEWKRDIFSPDYTHGYLTQSQVAYRAPAGWDIVAIDSDKFLAFSTVMSGHGLFRTSHLKGELASVLEIDGDKSGHELGKPKGTGVTIKFNDVRIRLAKQGQYKLVTDRNGSVFVQPKVK